MKIIVFSDIHGNFLSLSEFKSRLPDIAYDKIIFLGDIFGYYYDQKECISLLEEIPDLIWLNGNHDIYAVDAFDDQSKEEELISRYGHSYKDLKKRFDEAVFIGIKARRAYNYLTFDGKRIACFHGSPLDPLEGRIYANTMLGKENFEAYDVIFFGHTHCKIDRIIGNTHLLSPGSLGQPRDGKGYGFLVYDTESDSCDFLNVSIDNEKLRKEIDLRDNGLTKLYDVLSREENSHEGR